MHVQTSTQSLTLAILATTHLNRAIRTIAIHPRRVSQYLQCGVPPQTRCTLQITLLLPTSVTKLPGTGEIVLQGYGILRPYGSPDRRIRGC